MRSKVCPLSDSTSCTCFRRYLMCWDISFTRMLCSSSKRFSSITWSKIDLFNLNVLPLVGERNGTVDKGMFIIILYKYNRIMLFLKNLFSDSIGSVEYKQLKNMNTSNNNIIWMESLWNCDGQAFYLRLLQQNNMVLMSPFKCLCSMINISIFWYSWYFLFQCIIPFLCCCMTSNKKDNGKLAIHTYTIFVSLPW